MGDNVGQDAGGCLSVVAIRVALSRGLQVGQVLGRVGAEGLIDVGPGSGKGGERRSGERVTQLGRF